MARNWKPVPEEFTEWETETYTHLTDTDLAQIRSKSSLTSHKCTDPGKSVIKREWLVYFLNTKILDMGLSVSDYEICPRTLSDFILDFSAIPGRPRLTISSSSRNKYVLLENGAAAALSDHILSNLDKLKTYNEKAMEEFRRKWPTPVNN